MNNPSLIKSFLSDAAITAYRIVKSGSDDDHIAQGAAATDSLIGVADELSVAAAEKRIDVVLTGTVNVEFGGNVTRGGPVTADAAGKAVAAAPALGINNRVIGFAMVSAVAGDIAPILLSPHTMQGQ